MQRAWSYNEKKQKNYRHLEIHKYSHLNLYDIFENDVRRQIIVFESLNLDDKSAFDVVAWIFNDFSNFEFLTEEIFSKQ